MQPLTIFLKRVEIQEPRRTFPILPKLCELSYHHSTFKVQILSKSFQLPMILDSFEEVLEQEFWGFQAIKELLVKVEE